LRDPWFNEVKGVKGRQERWKKGVQFAFQVKGRSNTERSLDHLVTDSLWQVKRKLWWRGVGVGLLCCARKEGRGVSFRPQVLHPTPDLGAYFGACCKIFSVLSAGGHGRSFEHESIFVISVSVSMSILETANHLLPKSFRLAPK